MLVFCIPHYEFKQYNYQCTFSKTNQIIIGIYFDSSLPIDKILFLLIRRVAFLTLHILKLLTCSKKFDYLFKSFI